MTLDPKLYPYEEVDADTGNSERVEFDLTPHLNIQLADITLLLQEMERLHKEVHCLTKEKELLQAQIQFSPDGAGFQEAKQDFETLQGKLSQEHHTEN